MKTSLHLFLAFSSLATLPLSTAFTSLPPAIGNHHGRASTKLFNDRYDSMSMSNLKKVANEMGYDSQGVDRVGLIMIAKGWGSTVRGAKTLRDKAAFENEAARVQAERNESILAQREAAAKYQPQGIERNQGRSSVFGSSPNGSGFGDMSMAELQRVANEMGYDGQGLYQADLIMIAKGYGSTVRGAKTLRDKAAFEDEAARVQSERNESIIGQREAAAKYQPRGIERNQGRSSVFGNNPNGAGFGDMSMAELQRVANEMGYDGQGLYQADLIMIAKGYGSTVRGAKTLRDKAAFEDEAARVQSERNESIIGQREAAAKYQPRGIERNQGRSSVFGNNPNGAGFGDMSMAELKRIANEMGYDGQGLYQADLIMIAKGYGSTVRGARTLENKIAFENEAKRLKAEKRNESIIGQREGATKYQPQGIERNQGRSSVFGDMSMAELDRIANEMGYDGQGLSQADLIMIAKGYGSTVRGARTLENKIAFENEAKRLKAERDARALAEAEEARRTDYESMSTKQLRNIANDMGYDGLSVDRNGLIMIAKGYGNSVRGAQRL
jgi:hypothetical protein